MFGFNNLYCTYQFSVALAGKRDQLLTETNGYHRFHEVKLDSLVCFLVTTRIQFSHYRHLQNYAWESNKNRQSFEVANDLFEVKAVGLHLNSLFTERCFEMLLRGTQDECQ